jgi:integrase/recombinase XerD
MFIYKRDNTYYVEYFDNNSNKKKRISTGKSTKTAALEYVYQLQEKLNTKAEPVSISLSLFRDEYLNYTISIYSKKYLRSIRLSFRMLLNFLGDPLILQISDKDIERFLLNTHRRAQHAALLYKRTLSAAFNKAICWSYIDSNPFTKFKSPRAVRKFPATISEPELTSILEKVYIKELKKAFLIAYYTGVRQNELVNLKWDHVKLNEKIIVIKNSAEFTTKNKKERIIPISKHIFSELVDMNDNKHSEYVIPNKCGYKYHPDSLSHKFKDAVREAKLPEEIHFHSLRHSFASNLVRHGVSLYIVKELLGHSDIATTQIYAHLDNKSLISAIDNL